MKTIDIRIFIVMLILALLTACGQGSQTTDTNIQNTQPVVSDNTTPEPVVEPKANIASRSWIVNWHMELLGGTTVANNEIAIDTAGNTTAVWKQSIAGLDSIWASTYDAASDSWNSTVIISRAHNPGRAYLPEVAMYEGGNAAVVWSQDDGAQQSIYANSYNYSTGTWGEATLIDYAEGGSAYMPQVVMDEAGNAMAIWYQHDGTRYALFSSRFDAVEGLWGVAERVESAPYGDAFHPSIKATPSGIVMAVWTQHDGEVYSAWANVYDFASGGWGEPALIEDDNTDHVKSPVVAMNDNGDTIVSWYMYDDMYYSIYANMYDSGTGLWSGVWLVEEADNGDSMKPKVAIDNDGNAIVVWIFDDWVNTAIYTNRYDAASDSWSGILVLDSGESGSAGKPSIAVDANGDAVVVWEQTSESCMIKGSRYNAATDTWGAIESLCEQVAGQMNMSDSVDTTSISAYEPRVYFDRDGRAILIWRLSGSDFGGACVLVLS